MSLIKTGSLDLAIPPSALISAGILSKAITQQAPADSAILAYSPLTTSIITPPYKNLGKFVLTLHKESQKDFFSGIWIDLLTIFKK